MDRRTLSLVAVLAAVQGLALLLAALCQPAAVQATLIEIVPSAEPNQGPAVTGPTQPESRQAARGGASQFVGELPLRFVPNVGQTDAAVRYTVRGAGHILFFTSQEVAFAAVGEAEYGSRGSVVWLRFPGARSEPIIEGVAPMGGVVNYFLGSDPAGWRANVPAFQALAYRGLYPGIDLVYRGTEGHLKSEFLVAPGAEPGAIEMAYSGVEALYLREDGALVLQTAFGELVEEAPLIYQDVAGKRQAIPGGYVLQGDGRVGFWVGAYDDQTPLVIDPALTYSSFLGGSGTDKAWDNAVDGAGNIYVVGETASSNFPTHDAMDPTLGGSKDAFVTKIINTGGVYTYAHSTYLGGSGNDIGWGIDVDGVGNVYVSGQTESSNFPTHNAIDNSLGGSIDAFVTKIISASGVYTLGYSTYLGGSSDDSYVTRLAVEPDGTACVVGTTWSSNFPTHNAIDTSLDGAHDAFVTTIISANGVYTYGYSTYVGGSSFEYGLAVAVDGEGNAHITGDTWSSNFPTQNPIQASYAFGNDKGGDIFVTKIISTGGAYTYAFSTYLGGSKGDEGQGIAVDNMGGIYVTGRTYSYDASNDFPTHNAIQPTYMGDYDGIVTKIISASGVYTYAYSTFLGGTAMDDGNDLAADGAGNVYVSGDTISTDFPVTANAIQAAKRAGADAFVTKIISASGVYTYGYSTYLGGSGSDRTRGITLDGVGNVHLVGETTSSNWPTSTNAIQPSCGGSYDAFVAIIAPLSNLTISKFVTPATVAPGQAMTYTLVYAYDGSATVADVRVSDAVPITLTNVQYTSSDVGISPIGDISYSWQVGPLDPGFGGVITITGLISPSASGVFSLANQASITGGIHFVDDRPGDETATATGEVDGDPPLAPALVSPPDGSVIDDTTPTLTWQASPSPDAAGYLLNWNGSVMDVGDVNQYTTHVLADGAYTWTVAAYDAVDNRSSFTEVWTFAVEEAIAGLSAANDSPTDLGQATALTATVIAGSNVAYTWAFGDGATGSSAAVSHIYPAIGTFTAVVTASNATSILAATTTVTISQPGHYVYLPLIVRGSP